MEKSSYLNCYILIGSMLIHQTSGEYYNRCYNVSNYQHCLSTDLTQKTWHDAKAACQSNNSVLVSVTSSGIQSLLQQFRSYVSSTSNPDIDNKAVWIDVSAGTIGNFHWITGYPGAPTVDGQDSTNNKRFGAVGINDARTSVAFNAQTWSTESFYMCQYGGTVSCSDGYQQPNSVTCYKKYNNESVTWFTASNKCLTMGGSLATFNLTTATDDVSLTSWLNITGTTRYWVGLVIRWLVTTAQDGSVVDVQYTNWQSGNPSQSLDANKCVALEAHTSAWIDSVSCTTAHHFFCQAISQLSSTTATTTASTTTTTRNTLTTSTKLPLPLTSSSENAVVGSPDGRSRTTVLVANEHTSNVSSRQGSATSGVDIRSLGVGIGVGVGVPVIIAIIVVVVVLVKCRQNKSTQHEPKPSTAADGKKQKQEVVNNNSGSKEMTESIEVLEGSMSTQHLIDSNADLYARIMPVNHTKQPLPDVVYADLQTVASQNGQQNGGGNMSPTLSTTAA